MSQSSREGVIQFQLDYTPGPAPAGVDLTELNAWRRIFRRLDLLGQDPDRYGGLGFGNLSRRAPQAENGVFLISGTQTGDMQTLAPRHFATVLSCDWQHNRVTASGPVKPSSEALSHGILYTTQPAVNWVMHLHSPDIFTAWAHLKLPCTDPAASYGTPEMAAEIIRLAERMEAGKPHLLVMAGHEDGILAFGPTAGTTGAEVIRMLARALATQ